MSGLKGKIPSWLLGLFALAIFAGVFGVMMTRSILSYEEETIEDISDFCEDGVCYREFCADLYDRATRCSYEVVDHEPSYASWLFANVMSRFFIALFASIGVAGVLGVVLFNNGLLTGSDD